jgi:hypothetical protein
MQLYKKLANLILTRSNCKEALEAKNTINERIDYTNCFNDCNEKIEELINNYIPSGSGLDDGVKLDYHRSNKNKLVFNTSFHHIDNNGNYTGWTDHTITVVPDLISDIHLGIDGINRNEIKPYLEELFRNALKQTW